MLDFFAQKRIKLKEEKGENGVLIYTGMAQNKNGWKMDVLFEKTTKENGTISCDISLIVVES